MSSEQLEIIELKLVSPSKYILINIITIQNKVYVGIIRQGHYYPLKDLTFPRGREDKSHFLIYSFPFCTLNRNHLIFRY